MENKTAREIWLESLKPGDRVIYVRSSDASYAFFWNREDHFFHEILYFVWRGVRNIFQEKRW